MTRLILIRHGEAQGFVEGKVIGHLCTGLSERGRAQAIALRDRLSRTGEIGGPVSVYASLMRRSAETVEIIAPALGVSVDEIETDCRLCEMHPGEADGLSFVEYESRWTWDNYGRDRAYIGPEGSESVEMFVARVREALDDLATRHRGETVVIGCHGGVVNSSFEALGSIQFGTFINNVENTSITEWTFDAETGRWRLQRFNDHAHLT